MHTREARRAYLGKVRDCGAVGIKIDFVPAPSCSQMKWYEETLADTLEFSLMTDFHDRFLIIDNIELHGLGSSINCLGRRVTSYTTRDAREIAKLLAMVP
jgi:hypothetical protein